MSDVDTVGAPALRDLRRARRERRLGDTEWFDVLYRVYLFALVGSVVVLWASDSIQGLIDEPIATGPLLARGPSIAGVVAALAFGIGLRNGTDGGPISVESADVRHLLLAPLSRQRVLLRPISQRLRSVAFSFALGLGVLGQLFGREVEGSRASWAASGALFGAVVAVLYVGAAVVAHALRLPRWLATGILTIGVGWQSFVAWQIWNGDARGLTRIGPANLDGSLIFWGIRQRGIDVVAIVLALALVVAALALGGRLRLEALERRGQLVSQLRFAATVQDIRTVVLLRRQLRAESTRSRPWFARRRSSTDASGPTPVRPRRRPKKVEGRAPYLLVWQRGFVALRRLPLGRLLRITILAAFAGVTGVLAVEVSLFFLVIFVGCAFLIGLESLEPLAQEIDRPDLTDSLPIDRGWLFLNHLVAPAVLLAVAGLIAAAAASIVRPHDGAIAFALAVPLAWAGSIGAIVTTIGDAPEPASIANTTLFGADRGAESPFALPEFAGFSTIAKAALPIVLSGIAAIPIALQRVEPGVSTLGRSLIGLALCLTVTCWWVIRHDEWSVSLRGFFQDGRSQAAGGAR